MNQNEITKQLIGYARVSSKEQNLDSQIDMLKKAGCQKIFKDKLSGINADRPGWSKLMDYVRPGDAVVIAELSRMSRSLPHMLEQIKIFEEKQIEIISLREKIDTTTATGRFFISMMGAISQMERELKKERIKAGTESAKARGKSGGRPKTKDSRLEQARVLYENTDKSAREICDSLGIGRRTFFYHLAKRNSNKSHESASKI